MKKVLVIDNFDSFVFNLVQYIGESGFEPVVYRNNEITVQEALRINPSHVLISPGPGHPEDEHYFGISSSLIREMGRETPVLGVCLGHQGITTVFGGKVIRAPEVLHGKTSLIRHNGKGIFHGIPNPMQGMRYHSLIAERESFPSCLLITGETEDGIIMALEHKKHPIFGVQFHPESIGTPAGKGIIKNFLGISLSRSH